MSAADDRSMSGRKSFKIDHQSSGEHIWRACVFFLSLSALSEFRIRMGRVLGFGFSFGWYGWYGWVRSFFAMVERETDG